MSTSTMLMILAIIVFAVLPSLKDRVIPVKKLIITPAIFMYLFYQTIHENFFINDFIIIIGLMTGIALGIFIRSNTFIKADKNQLLIWLPGSYLSLVIFALLFSLHFSVGYLQSVSPAYLTQASFGEYVLLFLMSCASSITIGANGILYFKYWMSESGEQLVYVKK